MTLSAIILVHPSQLTSPSFLRAKYSVGFCDEVIVVSQTEQIADYSKQRNVAMRKAKGEWILFLDSDEEVALELRKEIVGAMREECRHNGFYFKRKDKFLGTWLKYGETTSVRLLRLARRDSGIWKRPVHERWEIFGNIGRFKHSILHYSHGTIPDMMRKIDNYTEIEAEYRLSVIAPRPPTLRVGDAGGRGNLIQMMFFPLGKFIQNYVFRLGILDGMAGFIHAGMMSYHSYLVRAKMINIKKQ